MPHPLAEKLREANTLGRALEAEGRTGDAMAAYRAALAADPFYLPAASNLGRLLVAREQPREAVALLEPIVAAAPFDMALAINYSNALLDVGRAVEAEQRLRIATARPDAPAHAYNSLGLALYVQRRYADAAAAFEEAIRRAPDFADAHGNYAHAMLHLGRYREAWREDERRWMTPPNTFTRRLYEQPIWDGKPLAGRTLLAHGRQGLGDTIQFARYLLMIPKDGGRIVLTCQEELAPLLGKLAGVDEVRVPGETLPPFDCQAPLASLPRLFGTDFDSIPDPTPYLEAKPANDIAAAPGLKIGLAWSGRRQHADDPHRNRSCDATHLLSLAAPGRRLYSLQIGEPAPPPIIDLGDRIKGFAGTAEIIAALDLVVTVDTSIAHLAAALGKPTWVLLPYAPDWRWRPRADGRNPWYRSVWTFRQTMPGDWLDAATRLGQALDCWNSGDYGQDHK